MNERPRFLGMYRLGLLLLFPALFLIGRADAVTQPRHSFSVGKGQFLLDGSPLEIHSGEMHFARIPRPYWRHRLQMAKAMGLNAIATYVFWNYHEVRPGVWDFSSENRDIKEFLRLAREEGLWVILRPGPYACAEWDFGGFPWFLQREESLVVRTNNPRFLKHTSEYFRALGSQVKDLLCTHGGPVIMVQIENEYGSYDSSMEYKLAIKKQLEEAGFDVPFFTSDGDWLFDRGSIPGILPTANGEDNVDSLKARVNRFHGGAGPYMVAEFYPGWLDHWYEPFEKVTKEEVAAQLETYLKGHASFNFYMVHGGTNFGFTSGANYDSRHGIQPDITSYDYDAPISEAGWATPKYLLLRSILQQHSTKPLPDVPAPVPVIGIAPVSLKAAGHLLDLKNRIKPVQSDIPLSFEQLNQANGFIVYSSKVQEPFSGTLSIDSLRDYALLYVNGKKVGELNRYYNNYSCRVSIPAGATLDILVENLGRINYGSELLHNRKGILGSVRIGESILPGPWMMYGMPFDSPPDSVASSGRPSVGQPTIYRGSFALRQTGDTFLDMREWGKGIVFVNGHNLGRYWNVGPQQTLYLPGCWLREHDNEIVIVELLNHREHWFIQGLRGPILDRLNTKRVVIQASFDSLLHACPVTMACEDSLPAKIYYTSDGSEPDTNSSRYDGILRIDEPVRLAARGFRSGLWSEVTTRLTIEPSLSWGKDVSLKFQPSPKYPGNGNRALVDGIRGSTDHHDGLWMGFEGEDLDATVDLGAPQKFDSVSVRFLQNIGAWIFLPDTVTCLGSADGQTYVTLGQITHHTSANDPRDVTVRDFAVHANGIRLRYIRLHARSVGTCPEWHSGKGKKAWIFADEISVR